MLDEAFEQPRAAVSVMVGFERPWCVAGGWAIDLALGRATREHPDVEIAIFREDQHLLRQYLIDWEFRLALEHRFVPWREGETLQLPHHELHAMSASGAKLE